MPAMPAPSASTGSPRRRSAANTMTPDGRDDQPALQRPGRPGAAARAERHHDRRHQDRRGVRGLRQDRDGARHRGQHELDRDQPRHRDHRERRGPAPLRQPGRLGHDGYAPARRRARAPRGPGARSRPSPRARARPRCGRRRRARTRGRSRSRRRRAGAVAIVPSSTPSTIVSSPPGPISASTQTKRARRSSTPSQARQEVPDAPRVVEAGPAEARAVHAGLAAERRAPRARSRRPAR